MSREPVCPFHERMMNPLSGGRKPGIMRDLNPIQSTTFVASLGIDVSIQVGEAGKRFKSVLVGMQDQQYLIIHLPQPLSLGRELREGMDLILRYVHFGSVYGCMVTVRGLILKPFPLLFLSYPNQVECVELRKVKRVECMLPATATGARWKTNGMIRDISSGGVLFCAKTDPRHETPAVEIGEPILLTFPLLGMEGRREFSAKVRRITHDGEEKAMGVEFEDLPPDIVGKIEAYVATISSY